jgi:HPt (histidine-containing phosphotransfer) domain-containing protein
LSIRESKNLKDLSDLGHFLKGSSAALGVERVQASCERIQHAGKLRDEETGTTLTEPQALALITDMLDNVKKHYPEARDELDRFFDS